VTNWCSPIRVSVFSRHDVVLGPPIENGGGWPFGGGSVLGGGVPVSTAMGP
jgi:hypothetical protein